VLAAIMGIGGGFIMVPVMVYLLRMPMHVVVGTNLFQEVFMCANVTVMQSWINHTVDFILALILLFGSVLGAQIGARISRRLRADQLKILLAVVVLLVMVRMMLNLLIAPGIMVSCNQVPLEQRTTSTASRSSRSIPGEPRSTSGGWHRPKRSRGPSVRNGMPDQAGAPGVLRGGTWRGSFCRSSTGFRWFYPHPRRSDFRSCDMPLHPRFASTPDRRHGGEDYSR